MVEIMDSGREVSEFELQSCYCVRFWINTLEKGLNPFIPEAMGLIGPQLFFYNDSYGIK